MATKIPLAVIQAYLAQQPPDTEINLATLATEINDRNLEDAVDYFCTLDEPTKVKYLAFVYNYYYYALTNGSFLWEPTQAFSEEFIVEIEDEWLHKYHINTIDLVPVRRLVSRLQKETAKQRVHRKEGDSVDG